MRAGSKSVQIWAGRAQGKGRFFPRSPGVEGFSCSTTPLLLAFSAYITCEGGSGAPESLRCLENLILYSFLATVSNRIQQGICVPEVI